MNDLVFNVKNLFDDMNEDGCLKQTECEKFYIAPYQRGYKWGNEPIKLLINDLHDAYLSSKKSKRQSEYYLQYITVKKIDIDQLNVLEIIDGQQRITTLTILFSLFDGDNSNTNNKLKYGVRDTVQTFLDNFIYKKNEDIFQLTWNDFVKQNEVYDEQDIFYMFNAWKIFDSELKEKFDIDYIQNNEENHLKDFKNYIKDNVKIIVNLVEPHISSEQIFSNLNSNRVPLTNVDLVKGLFLTKLVREGENKKSFKEILEKRASIGRQWDEMSNWLNRADVKSFYFPNYISGMDGLLNLLIKKEGINIDKDKKQYSLYNAIEKELKTQDEGILKLFNSLNLSYFIIKDWYEDIEIYNLLGYLLFSNKKRFKRDDLYLYLELKKDILMKKFKKKREIILEFENINDIKYKQNNKLIEDILLALSVFSDSNDAKFNYYLFQKEKWSLEHIFPQNPKLSQNEQLSVQDIENINNLKNNLNISDILKHKSIKDIEDVENVEKHFTKVSDILNNTTLNTLENLDIKIIEILLEQEKLNDIGNMALLSVGDNASMSNNMFNEKRMNLTKRVSHGSFIPKHTFDVFSKLLSYKKHSMNSNLKLWTKCDIIVHQKWIQKRINIITGVHNESR